MKKKEIVKKSNDFEKIIKNGKCIRNKYFIIHYLDNNLEKDRYGISVSKKLGNAVFRNRYKRKIRSIIDNYKKNYINSKDYIIILRKEAINVKHQDLQNSFFDLMNKKERTKNEE